MLSQDAGKVHVPCNRGFCPPTIVVSADTDPMDVVHAGKVHSLSVRTQQSTFSVFISDTFAVLSNSDMQFADALGSNS